MKNKVKQINRESFKLSISGLFLSRGFKVKSFNFMKKIFLIALFLVIIFFSYNTNVFATQPLPIKDLAQTFSTVIKTGDFYEWRYAGKAGEILTLRVSSSDFNPRIAVIDENGGFIDFNSEENRVVKQSDENGHFGWAILQTRLPYTGNYYFQIRSDDYDNKRGNVSIELGSDKSNIRADIRKDSLVAGEKYSVQELNQNQPVTTRTFLVEAFVKNIYKRPDCPPSVSCKPSMKLNIIISDDKDKKVDYSNMGSSDAIIYLGGNNETFQVGKKYHFKINVQNTSQTNVPQNTFALVSVNTTIDRYLLKIEPCHKNCFSGDLSVIYLATEKSATLKNSFTLTVSDEMSKDLKVGQLYKITMSPDGHVYDIVVTVSPIATSTAISQPAKQSVFVKFISWFWNLFR